MFISSFKYMCYVYIGFVGTRFGRFRRLSTGVKLVVKTVKSTIFREVLRSGRRIKILHMADYSTVDLLVEMVCRRMRILTVHVEGVETGEKVRRLIEKASRIYCIFVDVASPRTYMTYTSARRAGKQVTAYAIDSVGGRIVKLPSNILDELSILPNSPLSSLIDSL